MIMHCRSHVTFLLTLLCSWFVWITTTPPPLTTPAHRPSFPSSLARPLLYDWVVNCERYYCSRRGVDDIINYVSRSTLVVITDSCESGDEKWQQNSPQWTVWQMWGVCEKWECEGGERGEGMIRVRGWGGWGMRRGRDVRSVTNGGCPVRVRGVRIMKNVIVLYGMWWEEQ